MWVSAAVLESGTCPRAAAALARVTATTLGSAWRDKIICLQVHALRLDYGREALCWECPGGRIHEARVHVPIVRQHLFVHGDSVLGEDREDSDGDCSRHCRRTANRNTLVLYAGRASCTRRASPGRYFVESFMLNSNCPQGCDRREETPVPPCR